MKQKIYNKVPSVIKNILVTLYNLRFRKVYTKNFELLVQGQNEFFFNYSEKELYEVQNKRFVEFIQFAKSNNKYYKKSLEGIEVRDIKDIKKLPILTKENLRDPAILSTLDEELIKGYTGGSTGKSLEFYLTRSDSIKREATLSFFRGMYGFKFGDKIGWFSGKELVGYKEEKKNIFWVKDYLNKITYYSTFHLDTEKIDSMIQDMNETRMEYFAGFPSAIYEIAKRWKQKGIGKEIKLKAIFTTAEPLHAYQKYFLEDFFECPVANQYASSEGAHFIYTCPKGELHYDVTTGVFEQSDGESDEILVTSFTTHAMPLIRYKIGDKLRFDKTGRKCECGSNMPIVNEIVGRTVSFVYSKERGKIHITNIANIVKYMKVIDSFQLIQDNVDKILVKIVCFNCDQGKIENDLEYELRYRLGDKIKLTYEFVSYIAHEKNGKYMMIKNNILVGEMDEIR